MDIACVRVCVLYLGMLMLVGVRWGVGNNGAELDWTG